MSHFWLRCQHLDRNTTTNGEKYKVLSSGLEERWHQTWLRCHHQIFVWQVIFRPVIPPLEEYRRPASGLLFIYSKQRTGPLPAGPGWLHNSPDWYNISVSCLAFSPLYLGWQVQPRCEGEGRAVLTSTANREMWIIRMVRIPWNWPWSQSSE